MEKKLPFFATVSRLPVAPSFRISLSTKTGEDEDEEAVIRGLRSSRLFFDAAGTSSSLLENGGGGNGGELAPAFDGGVAVALESIDPVGDFLSSMEEMVEAHGVVRDWAWMQDMLGWFLRANGKVNHGFIISAFLDLVVGLASSSSSLSSPSRTCPPYSSTCSSCSSYSCEMEEVKTVELKWDETRRERDGD
ncbi:hypothetical protein KSP40_PGU001790 [Platanthera guangdongensis]|uniref:Transcription repressor n=1 Tax=Platanthera guangdongensis TaxID=2320717 RepID=A0ABR2M5K9_9ASPA